MEFTKNDKQMLLKCYGAREGDANSIAFAEVKLGEDLRQLEEAADVTEYTVIDKLHGDKERKITRMGAIRLLGREGWLSGIVRSAFHWDATRETKDGNRYVYFDSRRLFK